MSRNSLMEHHREKSALLYHNTLFEGAWLARLNQDQEETEKHQQKDKTSCTSIEKKLTNLCQRL